MTEKRSVETEELVVRVGGRAGDVSAIAQRPEDADGLFVLAHGAGAGMRHAFLEALAGRLVQRRIATFRYQFPYVESGRRRPDPPGLLEATVRAAVAHAGEWGRGLPVWAGGKSLGGRMTTRAQSAGAMPGVRGIVLVGFPLHPAGRPGTERAEHLRDVDVPMLFLQGTRDRLAEMELLLPVLEELPLATLHVVDGADHGFHVLKRSGRAAEEVLDELADSVRAWISGR